MTINKMGRVIETRLEEVILKFNELITMVDAYGLDKDEQLLKMGKKEDIQIILDQLEAMKYELSAYAGVLAFA